MKSLEAETYFEARVTLSGTFVRGYPMRGPSFTDPGEPGAPDSVEDVEITGVFASASVGDDVDLLEGVDPKAAERIKLNILNFLGTEADEALLSEAEEED